MHVLLVVPRFSENWGEFYQIPLGLGYIASAAKQAGHTVTGLNLNHYPGSAESLVAAKVAEVDPDVCASGALAPFLPALRSIFFSARKAKRDIINIGGGGLVSGEPEVSLDLLDLNYGVIGEGEITFVELLEALQSGSDTRKVNGIVYRDRTGIPLRTPPRPQVKDLGQFAWPDYELLETDKNIANQRPLDNYFFHTQKDSRPRAIDMITSRSCPFSCTFCFHPVGKTYRERPLDDFFAELDVLLARYDINMVALIDELFSLRKARLLEFCERIKPYNLHWMVQLHVSSASEEVLQAMYDAGASYISYGIESMSLPVLQSMKKKTKPERISAALDKTFERKIGIQGNLLFGDKAETSETANESMHWWSRNRHLQVNLTPLMVFAGSPDYYDALKDGLITDRKAYVHDPWPQLNISCLNDKNMEMMRFQVWVFFNTLLQLAPLVSFRKSPAPLQLSDRDIAYDIVWECMHCGHENDYRGVVLPEHSGHSLRMTCRECRTRWDVENRAREHETSAEAATRVRHNYGRPLRALMRKIRERKFGDIKDKLISVALANVPTPLRSLEAMGDVMPQEYRLKAVGSAVASEPFNPDRHCDFADALIAIGAHGAARLYFEQALSLSPGHARATKGLTFIDGPAVTDEQRTTYFVSWSDAPPPPRKERACSSSKEPALAS